MNAFHETTIAQLRNYLDDWRARLEEAEVDLRFREGQAAKARDAAETARQRVADYERLLAVAEPPADASAARGFEVNDVVSIADAENPNFGLRGTIVSTPHNGDVSVSFGNWKWSFRTSQLMHHADFVAQMDAAEPAVCATHGHPFDERGMCPVDTTAQPQIDNTRRLLECAVHGTAYYYDGGTCPTCAMAALVAENGGAL